jgi:hypothetical protein
VLSTLRIGEHGGVGQHFFGGWLQELLLHRIPQVDQHIETLQIYLSGQEQLLIAGRLARKAVQPKQLTVLGSDSLSSAMTALLATEQHHPMFQHVQHLRFTGILPDNMPQVSVEPPFDSAAAYDCAPAMPCSACLQCQCS